MDVARLEIMALTAPLSPRHAGAGFRRAERRADGHCGGGVLLGILVLPLKLSRADFRHRGDGRSIDTTPR